MLIKYPFSPCNAIIYRCSTPPHRLLFAVAGGDSVAVVAVDADDDDGDAFKCSSKNAPFSLTVTLTYR